MLCNRHTLARRDYCWKCKQAELEAENKALREAARKRCLYGHSRMCQREMETHSQPCTCGHDALAALIKEKN